MDKLGWRAPRRITHIGELWREIFEVGGWVGQAAERDAVLACGVGGAGGDIPGFAGQQAYQFGLAPGAGLGEYSL